MVSLISVKNTTGTGKWCRLSLLKTQQEQAHGVTYLC